MFKLIALAHAGGTAGALAPLRSHLPATLEFQLVERPGRGSRHKEPLQTDRPALVRQLCEELAPSVDKDQNRPYALLGHSLGAILAFELAHALLARGCRPPSMLFIAATSAPSVRPESFLKHDLSDAELERELRERGGTPPEFFDHPELMELFLPIVRADFRLCDGLSPQGLVLPCPIHVFAGTQDRIPKEDLLPWERETQHAFSLTWFEGGHFFVRSHAPQLCAAISERLVAAELLPRAAAAR